MASEVDELPDRAPTARIAEIAAVLVAWSRLPGNGASDANSVRIRRPCRLFNGVFLFLPGRAL